MEVPIARHLGSPQDIYRNMREEAVDAINTRGNGAGIRKNAAVAEADDLPIWVQMFAFGTCVASNFAVHVVCTLPNCTMPIDELPHIRVDDLLRGGMNLSVQSRTCPYATPPYTRNSPNILRAGNRINPFKVQALNMT